MTNLGAILTALFQRLGDAFRSRPIRGRDTWTPDKRNGPVVAICIGHSRDNDAGAYSVDGTTEWEFNFHVGHALARSLDARNIRCHVIDAYDGKGYTASMRWLGRHLSDLGATLAVELHFNSFGPAAEGHEYLYWYNSTEGQRLARELNTAHNRLLPDAKDRGIKPRTAGDRGALFLRMVSPPAVICEPFFGSNPSEWLTYLDHESTLVDIYAEGITNYLTR